MRRQRPVRVCQPTPGINGSHYGPVPSNAPHTQLPLQCGGLRRAAQAAAEQPPPPPPWPRPVAAGPPCACDINLERGRLPRISGECEAARDPRRCLGPELTRRLINQRPEGYPFGFDAHAASGSNSHSVSKAAAPWIAVRRSSPVPVLVKPWGTFAGPTTICPPRTTNVSSPSWNLASPDSTTNTSG